MRKLLSLVLYCSFALFYFMQIMRYVCCYTKPSAVSWWVMYDVSLFSDRLFGNQKCCFSIEYFVDWVSQAVFLNEVFEVAYKCVIYCICRGEEWSSEHCLASDCPCRCRWNGDDISRSLSALLQVTIIFFPNSHVSPLDGLMRYKLYTNRFDVKWNYCMKTLVEIN